MVAVLADPGHRRGLRTLDAGLIGEPDLVADGELGVIEHAVAVEVDLSTVCVEVSPLAFDVDVRHTAMLGFDVGLDVCALATGVILQLPARGAERVADGHVEILVRSVERMITADLDIGSRDG